jgi:hypothetical protein
MRLDLHARARVLALGALALVIACGQPPPPHREQFVLRALIAVPASAPSPTCSGSTQCPSLACATAACTNGVCLYSLTKSASCPCYEDDLRWCPGAVNKQVQFCQRLTDTATQWHASGGANVCGPTDESCATNQPDCPVGVRPTKFDLATFAWVSDPSGVCVPSPACPRAGETRRCETGDARCPAGVSTYGGSWGPCEKLNCPPELPPVVVTVPPVVDTPVVVPACTPRSHTSLVADGAFEAPFGCGHSINYLKGSRDCAGGTRESAAGDKQNDPHSNSHCEVVDWANNFCNEDPNRHVGNSQTTDACKAYSDGGVTSTGDNTDCRYIVHIGTGGCDGLLCQVSHVVRIDDGCH